MHKLQSALEYLMTYSWAILIIAIALVALYALNVFSPQTYFTNLCTMPAGFNCISDYLYGNGLVLLNVEYTNTNPISVKQVGCNSNETLANAHTYANAIVMNTGTNYTFIVQCYSGNTMFTGSLGDIFTGSAAINYTDAYTGFQNLIYGKLETKVVHK